MLLAGQVLWVLLANEGTPKWTGSSHSKLLATQRAGHALKGRLWPQEAGAAGAAVWRDWRASQANHGAILHIESAPSAGLPMNPGSTNEWVHCPCVTLLVVGQEASNVRSCIRSRVALLHPVRTRQKFQAKPVRRPSGNKQRLWAWVATCGHRIAASRPGRLERAPSRVCEATCSFHAINGHRS